MASAWALMACAIHWLAAISLRTVLKLMPAHNIMMRSITIPGCDKNMPGSIMAMGRLNRPAIMLYGGTIAPGHYKGQDLNIVSHLKHWDRKLQAT